MLRRKIYDELLNWKNRKHKCLLIKGQRQVGKTFIIDYFGKTNYDNYVRIDLSKNTVMNEVFEGDLDVDRLINSMSLVFDTVRFVPGSTLIFLDEIQYCPRARTSLKYFTEDGRYDVIASGSMLDVRIPFLKDSRALLPVGYEEQLTMYSLDFEEFLWAKKVEEGIIPDIRKHIHEKTPADEFIVKHLADVFREFMIVGGMPEAVNKYLETGNFAEADRTAATILNKIEQDIRTYNTNPNAPKTSDCFNSVPSQLSESNKKFMYSRIDGEGSRKSAEKYGENLLWIENAGYANFCRRLRSIQVPLIGYTDPRHFKVYMSDTGILMHMMDMQKKHAVLMDDTSVNQGAVTENVVAECLVKSGIVPRYYRNDRGKDMMELDFVIELGPEIAVIEVKSGKHREAPSIRKSGMFAAVSRRIMLEKGNIMVDEDGIEHYPLFAAAFMHDMESEWDDPRFRPLTSQNRSDS